MSTNKLRHDFLTIELPEGWEDVSQVIALGPEDDGFRPNVVFSQEPTELDEDATDFAARQLPALRRVLANHKIVREQYMTLGSNTGFLREQTFAMEEKGEVAQFQFYIIRNGRAYTFTITHKKERFERLRKLGEELIANATLDLGEKVEPDRSLTAEF